MRGWVANRFYYQVSIPIKDAAVLSNCPDREVRRQWIIRILEQDGTHGSAGGNEAWLRLGELLIARWRSHFEQYGGLHAAELNVVRSSLLRIETGRPELRVSCVIMASRGGRS